MIASFCQTFQFQPENRVFVKYLSEINIDKCIENIYFIYLSLLDEDQWKLKRNPRGKTTLPKLSQELKQQLKLIT